MSLILPMNPSVLVCNPFVGDDFNPFMGSRSVSYDYYICIILSGVIYEYNFSIV